MLENVTATPFLGLFLILVCWIIGVKLQKKTGWLVCNPVLTSSCMIVLILMATGIPLDHFRTGGSLISMLLGPATAVLALTIYRQKAILHEHFLPILIGCAFGSLVSIAAAVARYDSHCAGNFRKRGRDSRHYGSCCCHYGDRRGRSGSLSGQTFQDYRSRC